MPTYKPLNTSVKLVTYSLADTTTSIPKRSQGGDDNARRDIEAAGKALFNAPKLTECHLSCFDDTTRLHFLGDVPFYLVQAGADLFQPKTSSLADRTRRASTKQSDSDAVSHDLAVSRRSSTRSRAASVASEPPEEGADRRSSRSHAPSNLAENLYLPQALGLQVTLSKQSFLRRFDKGGPCKRGTPQSIKVDVFFNGELAGSTYTAERFAVRNPTTNGWNSEIVKPFSGRRLDTLLEQPWVIIPPSMDASGALRSKRQIKAGPETIKARWQLLNAAIKDRADEYGYNEAEERSVVGKYLADLAEMELPDSVVAAQTSGSNSHAFGIIDVVISAGIGWVCADKGSARALRKPELHVDKRFKQMPAGWTPAKDRAPPAPVIFDAAPEPKRRRITTAPDSYRDARPFQRKTQITEVSISDAVAEMPLSTDRNGILPPFPQIPQMDFADLLSTTPHRAETILKHRCVEDTVSPTAGVEKRKRDSATSLMPPPPSPVLRRMKKRRRLSDTISISGDDSPQSVDAVGASGRKTVSSYQGMARGNLFGEEMRRREAKAQAEQAAMGRKSVLGHVSGIVKSIVVHVENKIRWRKMLSIPYSLTGRRRIYPETEPDPTSRFQPIHESRLFALSVPPAQQRTAVSAGTLTAGAVSPLTMQPPTPMSTSSPIAIGALEASLPAMTPTNEHPATQSSVPNEVPESSPLPAPTPTPDAQPTTAGHSSPKAPAADLGLSDPPAEELESSLVAEQPDKPNPVDLCKDCVIGFAEGGEWQKKGEKGKVFRHVRTAKAGEFQENEVLFAVRYVITG